MTNYDASTQPIATIKEVELRLSLPQDDLQTGSDKDKLTRNKFTYQFLVTEPTDFILTDFDGAEISRTDVVTEEDGEQLLVSIILSNLLINKGYFICSSSKAKKEGKKIYVQTRR